MDQEESIVGHRAFLGRDRGDEVDIAALSRNRRLYGRVVFGRGVEMSGQALGLEVRDLKLNVEVLQLGLVRATRVPAGQISLDLRS